MVEWNSHPFIFDFYFLKISDLLIWPLQVWEQRTRLKKVQGKAKEMAVKQVESPFDLFYKTGGITV